MSVLTDAHSVHTMATTAQDIEILPAVQDEKNLAIQEADEKAPEAIDPQWKNVVVDAIDAEQDERSMTVRHAFKLYPKAIAWSFAMSLVLIMEVSKHGDGAEDRDSTLLLMASLVCQSSVGTMEFGPERRTGISYSPSGKLLLGMDRPSVRLSVFSPLRGSRTGTGTDTASKSPWPSSPPSTLRSCLRPTSKRSFSARFSSVCHGEHSPVRPYRIRPK